MFTGVRVAVDNAAFKFDKLYSYSVPPSLCDFAIVGARVLIPFGKSAPRMGVVLELCEVLPEDELKSIIDIEKTKPILSPELVRIVLLLHETTFCTYFDAVKVILPKNSRLVPDLNKTALESLSSGHIETVYSYSEKTVPERLTEKQRAVCDLIKNNPMTAVQICEKLNCTRSIVERLFQKGIVDKQEQTKEDVTYKRFLGELLQIPDLSIAQQQALLKIERLYADSTKPNTTLLYGVTSSGKTHIYVKLIETAVGKGLGALVLVPEIALATQMIYRLKELFGSRVGIIHSSLSDSERQIQWENINSGSYDVIVGTRSAVFAPINKLGIIIVDEEQEQSYLSEHNPRFDACAVAQFRANENGAKLLFSSATPSVESYYYAQVGKYNFVALNERFGNMPLPTVRVVDMRAELLADNSHHISLYLKEQIDTRILKKEQCILLLNRRGYRTVSMCCACKKIVKCQNCDTPLVIHKNRGCYVCHYCQKTYPIALECDECGGNIKHTGIGTQKIEEDLQSLFPTAKILRLDLDTVQKKHSLEQQLAAFQNGEYDMIIGTQMIAKGLDFKNVTLVGVLSIDQLLLMPSFRANERTFSMLTQVVGRSGRGSKTGEAIIQTIDPDNSIIKLAARQDYESFYKNEIVSRKMHLYPPFCSFCSIGIVGQSEIETSKAADELAKIVEQQQKQNYPDIPIRVLGPSPMRVAYINKIYRYRLIIKCRNNRRFRDFLRECIVIWNDSAYNNKIKAYVDFKNELDS